MGSHEALQVHLSVNGCRFTWLITLSCRGNDRRVEVRSKVRLKPSLPAHLPDQNMASQFLDCQSFLTRNILMAGFVGKRLRVGEIFFVVQTWRCSVL